MGIRKIAAYVIVFAGLVISAACQTRGPSSGPKDDYPIMSWEVRQRSDNFPDPHHGLSTLIDCGYTRVGFVRAGQLPLCEKLGIKAFVRNDDAPLKWETMSDEQIDTAIKTLVQKSKHSPMVLGYFVTDEPGVQKFPQLAKAVAAVRKYAPGKIAYINLYPDYATIGAPNLSQLGTPSYTEYVERFVKEVKPDLISYDNYRIIASNDLKDAKPAESYFRNLVEVRRIAQANHLPFWHIVCGNQIRSHTVPPSPANLQLQAFTTLAAGADCLTWFTYYGGTFYGYASVNNDGNRTATWSYLRMVNEQVKVLGPIIRPLKSTGVYFTSPAPTDGLPALPAQFTQELRSDTPLMVGEFSGSAGEKYVMLVNLSLQKSSKVFPKMSGAHKVAGYISPVDGSLLKLDKEDSLWLTAGQGALLKLQ